MGRWKGGEFVNGLSEKGGFGKEGRKKGGKAVLREGEVVFGCFLFFYNWGVFFVSSGWEL